MKNLNNFSIYLDAPTETYAQGINRLKERSQPFENLVENFQASTKSVLVEIKAAAINFPDLMQMVGSYQTKRSFPYIPGIEGSGVVLKSSSEHFTKGDRVMFYTRGQKGTFSKFAIFPETFCFKTPKQLTNEEASCFLVGFMTAFHTLVEKGKVHTLQKPTILLSGATGGMGMAACQLAACYNAEMIIAGGSDEKLNLVESVVGKKNIKLKINYNKENDFASSVRKLYPLGVDIVWDCVGGESFMKAIKCAKYGGRVLVVGFTSGSIPRIPTNYILIKELSVLGCRAGQSISSSSNANQRRLLRIQSLSKLVEEKGLKPFISKKYSITVKGSQQALRDLLHRKIVGRCILVATQSSSL